jgi:trehalose-6-phosphate synthase
VQFKDNFVTVGAFPIGIDPEKFTEGLQKPKGKERISALERKFQGVKLIVGVDRLDYIKGVPQKMHALEVFLTEHPEWVGRVVLVQVAVPSRGDVEEYQNLRAAVNELVGRINGKFGEQSLLLTQMQLLIDVQARSNSCRSTSCTSPSPSTKWLPSTPSPMYASSPQRATA